MMRFRKEYFLVASGLLLLEIGIALYVRDSIIRPYGGDFLAVIFVYCLGRSWPAGSVKQLVLAALLVAYSLEIGQYFNLLAAIGLQHSRLARVVLGSQFAWGDMLAYTAGALAVLAVERWRFREAGPAPELGRK